MTMMSITLHEFEFCVEEVVVPRLSIMVHLIRCPQLGKRWQFVCKSEGDVQAFLRGFDIGRAGKLT